MQQIGKSNHNEERNSTFEIHPSTKTCYVSLNVSDIQRSLEFYQSVLGFSKVRKNPSASDRVLLSSGETQSYAPMLKLGQVGQTDSNPVTPRRAGLYHFAILLPERKNLADALLYLSDKQDQVHFDGLADHLVSDS
jgi:catechol 2,3-dioxygenase